MSPSPRVLISFGKATDSDLKVIADSVLQGLTGNAALPSPPVALSTLANAIKDYEDALVAQEEGGKLATAVKKAKRETLVGILRKLAGYVEDNCNGNLATLLSSGFKAASTSHAQQQLPAPFIVSLVNGNSGQLRAKLREIIPNAKCYELRNAAVGTVGTSGPWQSGGLTSNSRGLFVNDLTPGTRYAVQVRAIGGATGYSDWSDAVTHMSL